jgi:hypothetical protein
MLEKKLEVASGEKVSSSDNYLEIGKQKKI